MADRTLPARAGLGFRIAVGAMFALSGAAALIDEVAWTRWLTLAVGSSTQATLVVLGSFMGGLGLGAWIAGRIGDRRPERGLALFAGLEGLVGVWTLVSIPLLGSWLPEWSAALARAAGRDALPWSARAGLSIATLVIPTMLMGATLPLLARWALAAGGLPGRDVGVLYTLNTIGGASGALIAAFYLIERFGLARSVLVAAAADFLVAGLAFLMARRLARAAPRVSKASRAKTEPGARGRRKRKEGTAAHAPAPGMAARPVAVAATGTAPVAAALFGFFVSGLCGLGLEVVAHRIIAILAGSTTYAFAVMLAAFLIGIAAGSFAGAWIADRLATPGALLALSLAGLSLGIGIARLVFASGWWQMAGRVARGTGLSGWSYGLEMAGCLVALLPATLMLGLAVPCVGRLTAVAPERFAHRFGAAYALNTLGAVCGVLVAGLILVPRVGTAGALTLLALLAGIASLAVALLAVGRGRRLAVAGLALAVAAAGPLLARGTDPVRDALHARAGGHELLDLVEGPVQTIAVVREFNDQQLGFLRLITNRTSLTGTHLYAKRYMRLLGHLPALWAETPRRALVICLGTGMTAGAVAAHPDVEHIDVVEISPEVVRVAPLFEKANGAVLDDPRVHLHVEDGRHIMLVGGEPWDVITLEPPPPRDSGVVSLYTTDFYELARERLTPGGVVAQWIPLHSQSLDEIQMLVRSFLDVFPDAIGLLPVERDLVLLGANRELKLDPERLDAALREPGVRKSLAEIGIRNAADLFATVVLDPQGLSALAGDAPAVTDDRPRVEYFARYGKTPRLPPAAPLISRPPRLASLLTTPPSADLASRVESARETLFKLHDAAWVAEAGDTEGWEQRVYAVARARPDDPYVLWAAQISDEHLDLFAELAERTGDASVWQRLGRKLVLRSRFDDAVVAYRGALAANPDDLQSIIELGDLLLGPGRRPAEGRALLEEALRRLGPNHRVAPRIAERLRRAPPRSAP